MATKKPLIGEKPPLCACGCNGNVNWMPGKGWAQYVKGHAARGKPGSRLGVTLNEETKKRMSDAAKRRYAGKRQRDLYPLGRGVYSTNEYREARDRLVKGKPCQRCGAIKDVCAHHQIPGNDESLIPLCRKCHPTEHAATGAKGKFPPQDQKHPLCACGCGLPVGWKRVRGWAKYCKGHGNAKVPAVAQFQEPPKCGCGCGEPVKFRNGKGWNQYKRGHGQRIEGHYFKKQKMKAQECQH